MCSDKCAQYTAVQYVYLIWTHVYLICDDTVDADRDADNTYRALGHSGQDK